MVPVFNGISARQGPSKNISRNLTNIAISENSCMDSHLDFFLDFFYEVVNCRLQWITEYQNTILIHIERKKLAIQADKLKVGGLIKL